MRKRTRELITLGWILALAGACSHSYRPENSRRAPSGVMSSGPLKRVIIAVDGMSFEAFKVAQGRGLFPEFKNVGKHIAPFPSMTDVSWSKIFHTAEVFGNAGRIRYPEATYFDSGSRTTIHDPREYFRRLADRKHYFNAFDVFYNPYLESLMYVPNQEVSKEEVRSVIQQIKSLPEKETITAYFGSADSAAHTRKDQLFTVIEQISSAISELMREYREAGRTIEFAVVSDHGNVGDFTEGGEENYLTAFPTMELIQNAGFKLVNKFSPLDRDGNADEIQAPLLALGNYASFFFRDLRQREKLVAKALEDSRIEHAIYLESGDEQARTYRIQGKDGSLSIQHIRKTGEIRVSRRGDPVVFEVNHPLAVDRVVEAFSEADFESADLYLTLKDGYYFDNPLSGNVKMVRTHGSLSARSSEGVLASTTRRIPEQVLSSLVLAKLEVDPFAVFRDELEGRKDGKQVAGHLTTYNDDFGDKALFYRLTQFLNESRYFFDVKNADALLKAFAVGGALQNRRVSSLSEFDLKSLDLKSLIGPADVGQMADLILKYKDVEKIQADAAFQELKAKIQKEGLHIEPDSADSQGFVDKLKKLFKHEDALAVKEAVMKLWALPHLLKRSFNIPELEAEPDPRSASVKSTWDGYVRSMQEGLKDGKKFEITGDEVRQFADDLFREVYEERRLMAKLAPVPVVPRYQASDANVALVFVPGIYDSLFDGEIFRSGLDSLSEAFGVRVLRPPVESGCSSNYNAKIVMDFIQSDRARLLARKKRVQRYFIIGYSKGGVDALTALLLDREFTSKYILGLATIASPLSGASILNTADLPVDLVNLLSRREIPGTCLGRDRASSTMTPSAMMTFWNRNRSQLLGLTRYYSMTFISEPEESHPWMKASKIIGRFKEANDGVVTASSSQFPGILSPIDLGVLSHTDHLAGIVASDFPQRPFMEALWVTLSQLGAFAPLPSLYWNLYAMRRALKQNPQLRMDYVSGPDGTPQVSLRKRRLSVSAVEKYVSLDYGVNWKSFVRFPAQKTMDFLSQIESRGPKKKVSTYQPEFVIPLNTIGFDGDNRLDAKDYPAVLGGSLVTPITAKSHPAPAGITIKYQHPDVRDFMNEYQFAIESNAPSEAEGSDTDGWRTEMIDGSPWAKMTSKGTSTRLTSFAMRFSLNDFPNLNLKYRVDENTKGADPIKGGNGKDDSPFQLWLMVRKIKKGMSLADRAKLIPEAAEQAVFGYYWAEPNSSHKLSRFETLENTYSRKNFVAVVLPLMKQMVLGFEDKDLGKPQDVTRNVKDDIEKAFGSDAEREWEVVGITFQQDSNDSKSSSKAYFKELKFY